MSYSARRQQYKLNKMQQSTTLRTQQPLMANLSTIQAINNMGRISTSPQRERRKSILRNRMVMQHSQSNASLTRTDSQNSYPANFVAEQRSIQ